MNNVTENYIEEILGKLKELKDRINKYKEQYSKNEWLVRYSLIDPFLRLLGWNTENPEEVVPELTNVAGRPDYTLFKDNKKLAFIGAKKLGTNEDIKQHLNYCNGEGIIYFIATDGNCWHVYDNSFYSKPVNERITIEWSILTDSSKDIFIKALYISKWFFGIKYDKLSNLETNDMGLYNNKNKSISKRIVDMETDNNDHKKIRRININGSGIDINSAMDILIETFKWILNKGHIKNIQIPLKSGKIRYIVNTSPIHQNGKPFRTPIKVGDYYIECNNSLDRTILLAKKLLTNAGLNPDVLKIETW